MTDNLMNDTQPLLTIAIPTYNRASYLALCLKRISEELDSLHEDQRKLIKVYVSNNASTDDTDKIVSQYRLMQAGEFEVVCNGENIGADFNIVQCYSSAITPYVWILGDDDVILPGGLAKVLVALLQNDVDILYLNNYWFKDDYTEKLVRYEKCDILRCKDSVDFARRTNVMLTFISGLIVRSGIGLEHFSDVLHGSNLSQLGWVLPLLREGKCFVVVEDVVVAAKGSNSGGYELVKVFGNNLKKITDSILKNKPKLARAIQNGAIVNFFPASILEFRKGVSRYSDKNMVNGLEEAFSDNWRYYIFLSPLIFLPLPMAGFYHMLLRVFRRLFGSVIV